MFLTEWDDELPTFARVLHIFRMAAKLYFIIQPWKTLEFNYHYQAYAASEAKEKSLELKEPNGIFEHRPVHAVKNYKDSDNTWYIPLRYALA